MSTGIDIETGSILDFGTRPLIVAERGSLRVGPGAMTIRAASLTLEPGAAITARGRDDAAGAGGDIAVETTAYVLVKSSGRTMARFDLSARQVAGSLSIVAGSDIEIAGVLAVNATTAAGVGGSLQIRAGRSVTLASGSQVTVAGGSTAVGGDVGIVAMQTLSVQAPIDASGGDGGLVELASNAGLSTTQAGAINVDATGVFNDGGDVTLVAGGNLSIAGSISGRGSGSTLQGGGFGGFLTVLAGGSVTVPATAVVDFSGAAPDGEGGEIELDATLDLVQLGLIAARGPGTDGAAGFITLTAERALTSGPLDVEGGGFGGGNVSLSGGDAATVAGLINADGVGGGGVVEVDAQHVTVRSRIRATGLTSGAGGDIDVAACNIDVLGGQLDTTRPGGRNTFQASGQIVLGVNSVLRAGAENRLEHRNPGMPPQRHATAVVVPDPLIVLNTRLPRCHAPACGDGELDPQEDCDDFDNDACDGCSPVCTIEECGNGGIDCGEECDDGNVIDDDGCDSNCTETRCGNGVRTVGEPCDDGNTAGCDGCSPTCLVEMCGNGRVDCGEDCDGQSTICDANCAFIPGALCGNNAVDTGLGEECDDGGQQSCDGCSRLCKLEACGNGRMDCLEECEDLNTNACDGCSPRCRIEVCGNNSVDCLEECDDGDLQSGDGCDANCTLTDCGNGIITPGERCDDGNLLDGDGCDSNCTPTGCGNGVTSPGEGCDDGDLDSCDGCSSTCVLEACGNNDVSCAELCDDGNTRSGDGCDANCTPTGCGNGVRTSDEACDDGDTDACDGCSPNCRADAVCGDRIAECGEECDNGRSNGRPGNACSSSCRLVNGSCRFNVCGDGIAECAEECDDFNNDNCDGCSPTCLVEECGNASVDCGEPCDTGGDSETCDRDCTPVNCGDGLHNAPAGEQCDDGNINAGDGCDGTCRSEVCDLDTDCDPLGRCAGRQCIADRCEDVAPLDCDDDDPGTMDRCTIGAGGQAACTHSCISNAVCDDGNPCNGSETCTGGICRDGVPPAGFVSTECSVGAIEATLDAIDEALQGASPGDLVGSWGRKLGNQLKAIRALVARAIAATKVRKQNKLLTKAQGKLTKLRRTIGKGEDKGKIAPLLADSLASNTVLATDAVAVWRGSLTP